MTANQFEQVVREEVEPSGARLVSDDGITVFRPDFIDGFMVHIKRDGLVVTFYADHRTPEEKIREGAREALRRVTPVSKA